MNIQSNQALNARLHLLNAKFQVEDMKFFHVRITPRAAQRTYGDTQSLILVKPVRLFVIAVETLIFVYADHLHVTFQFSSKHFE